MPSFAALVSLGCAKNLVDSEIMIPQVEKAGYMLTDDLSKAELIVVNTCGFLESAVQEAVDTILEVSQHKIHAVCKTLVVTGCMVQRYGRKLRELLPEVDVFLGTSHYHELLGILQGPESSGVHIRRPDFLMSSHVPRKRSTPFYSAYLKVADGCSHRCTYCMIPHLRGPYRSRSVGDIYEEASQLVSEGVKEINLIAQDLTALGSDRHETGQLATLLESLENLAELKWVRLLYVYPDRVDAALLETMAWSHKVVPYLDIPFQHCSPKVLKAMGRGADRRHPRAILALIRDHLPQIALRTSLMVGFPGESAQDFEELLLFLDEAQFDHVGAFPFSPERGTKAARMPGQIPESLREERLDVLMKRQREISRRRLAQRIGERLDVLVEGYHAETELLLSGRASIQAPEVDGAVIITRGEAEIGEIRPAVVTGAHDYDLEVELDPAGPLS